MKCSAVKSRIKLYMDNQLDARSTLDVQQHLASCLACSQLKIYTYQDQQLKNAAQANVMSAIRHESDTKQRPLFSMFSWRPFAFTAAVVVVIAVVITGVLWITDFVFYNNVYASVVSDHAKHCSLENVEGKGAVTNTDELNRLVTLYGNKNTVPDLSSFGYYKPHGLICMIKGNKTLHLIYYDKKQQPLSVFLRLHRNDGIAESWIVEKNQNFNVSSKINSVRDVLVVSAIDGSHTAAIANFVLSK